MLKNKTSKFTKDVTISFFSKILQLIIGIGSSVIIARTLGPEGKGIYALAIFLPSIIMSFGNFGIGQASIFYLGKKEFSTKETLKNNIILSIIFSLIGILIGLVILFFWGSSLFPDVEKNYLIISLFLIIPNFFSAFINAILLGIQKIKEYNYINIFGSLLFLFFLIIFLITVGLNIKTAIIAVVLSAFTKNLIVLFLLKKLFKSFTILKSSNHYFKKVFKYGFKIYFANLIQFFHYKIDLFIINLFLNPFTVGLYSIAVTLAEKVWLIPQSVGLVLFPKISNENNKNNLKNFTPTVCRNVLFITFLGLILLFIFSELIISLLYSRAFLGAVIPLKILTIGILTLSGWKILANDLYGRGKANLNMYINLAAVILNITLNILLIPKYGINGAAWASSISYTLTFMVMLIVFSTVSNNKIKDIIFIKKSDFKYYRNFLLSFKNKYFNSKNNL